MTDFVTKNTTPANSTVEEAEEPIDHAKNYKIKLIEDLIAHVRRESEFAEKFRDLFGAYPGIESETCQYRFVNDLISNQVKIVATLIGDTNEGLQWFLYDNECGDKGYEAGIDEGETRKIKTIEDYLWLVDLDKEGI